MTNLLRIYDRSKIFFFKIKALLLLLYIFSKLNATLLYEYKHKYTQNVLVIFYHRVVKQIVNTCALSTQMEASESKI